MREHSNAAFGRNPNGIDDSRFRIRIRHEEDPGCGNRDLVVAKGCTVQESCGG